MSEPERTDNRVERIISKWKMLHVSFTKFDGRVQSPRQFYHLWRQVDADRAGTAICGFGCKSTRPARNVQQICTGARLHGVEQGIGGERGYLRKKCVIAPRQSIMTLAFEGTQSFCVAAGEFCRRQSHHALTGSSGAMSAVND